MKCTNCGGETTTNVCGYCGSEMQPAVTATSNQKKSFVLDLEQKIQNKREEIRVEIDRKTREAKEAQNAKRKKEDEEVEKMWQESMVLFGIVFLVFFIPSAYFFVFVH